MLSIVSKKFACRIKAVLKKLIVQVMTDSINCNLPAKDSVLLVQHSILLLILSNSGS